MAKAKSSSSRANSSSRMGNTESRSSIVVLFVVATEKVAEEIPNAESWNSKRIMKSRDLL